MNTRRPLSFLLASKYIWLKRINIFFIIIVFRVRHIIHLLINHTAIRIHSAIHINKKRRQGVIDSATTYHRLNGLTAYRIGLFLWKSTYLNKVIDSVLICVCKIRVQVSNLTIRNTDALLLIDVRKTVAVCIRQMVSAPFRNHPVYCLAHFHSYRLISQRRYNSIFPPCFKCHTPHICIGRRCTTAVNFNMIRFRFFYQSLTVFNIFNI